MSQIDNFEKRIKNLFFLPALISGLGLTLAGRVTAQTFTTLHTFTTTPVIGSHTNSDGASPNGGMVLSGNTLYGTTAQGGTGGNGTVFRISTDGTGFTNLYSFSANSNFPNPFITNSDGAYPGELVLSGSVMYGTTYNGGTNSYGTIFAINTDGTGFTNLHTFTGLDGSHSLAGLLLSGSTLYGTTLGGGSAGGGTVFRINTDGTGFSNLYNFNGGLNYPSAQLVLSSNTVYGTTAEGGSPSDGTVFAIETNGTSFTILHNFNGNDGADTYGGVVFLNNTLYGTTAEGGDFGRGSVFAVNTDGTGFTNLHSFDRDDGSFGVMSGPGPIAVSSTTLFLSGNTLYGTTPYGGSAGAGTIFTINTDGTGFNSFYNFPTTGNSFPYTNSDGAVPDASLILSGNTLYGTASTGGSAGEGTVFSISLPINAPQLTIMPSITNVVLSWPTNATDFTLQFTTNLVPPAVWSTNSPSPVVVNGQNTVTNPISGTQKFYRLSQ